MSSNNDLFNNNLKVEDAFNTTLDSKVWIHHEGKTAQAKIGDFYNTLLGINVDFKVDCYDNKNNIVLEVNQVSGTNWIDELDRNSFIGYVKINTGVVYFWQVSQLLDFRNTSTYKSRKEKTAWSGTTYKNFRLSEMPKPAFLHKVHNEDLITFLKRDVQGDDKYENNTI